MSFAAQNLENLLRLINDKAPESWFPRLYCEQTGVALEAVNYFLEELYLDGLVVRGAPSTKETGPGVVLTTRGRQLLQDEVVLNRLREGKALDPKDRGGRVREFLRRTVRPWITWVLLALNFAVFGYEIYLANQRGLTRDLLGWAMQGGNNLAPILMDSGAIRGDKILDGQWWRLLSSCFVHIGLLHLFSNMYVLWREGYYFEQMWGWWRYLLIYLVSGLGGSLLAVAFQPLIATAGASGALCGLLSSAGVWMILNRRHLPRQVFRRWIGAFIINTMLIAFLSFFPGVSRWAHAGGALLGVIMALLLNWQRFGSSTARWVGLLLLLPLPYLGYQVLERQRATSPAWKRLEDMQFQPGGRLGQADGPGWKLLVEVDQVRRESEAWSNKFGGLWRRDQANWKNRDPVEVKALLEELDRLDKRITTLKGQLGQARQNYRQPANLTFVDRARELLQVQTNYHQACDTYLKDRMELTAEDRQQFKTLQKEADQALDECRGLEQKRLDELKGAGTP